LELESMAASYTSMQRACWDYYVFSWQRHHLPQSNVVTLSLWYTVYNTHTQHSTRTESMLFFIFCLIHCGTIIWYLNKTNQNTVHHSSFFRPPSTSLLSPPCAAASLTIPKSWLGMMGMEEEDADDPAAAALVEEDDVAVVVVVVTVAVAVVAPDMGNFALASMASAKKFRMAIQ
jgi:hypothetical protein